MNYHFVFCSRYRKLLLVDRVKLRLEELIREKVKDLGCEVVELKIMPDHVELLLAANPTVTPSRLIFQIKNYTSKKLKKEFEHLKRAPPLWTRSYLISTADNLSTDTIQKYIRSQ